MDISICTWNLWFEPIMQKERITAAMNELLKTNTVVICLQEITPQMLKIIMHHTIIQSYRIYHTDDATKRYGQIFLVNRRLDSHTVLFEYINFPKTDMDRKICRLTINKNLHILNVHLESEFTKPGHVPVTKITQIKYLQEYAATLRGHVIIAGDCNISTEEDQMFTDMMSSAAFIDLNNGMLTFDSNSNTNVDGDYQSRLDRILCNFSVTCHINKPLGLTPFITAARELYFPSDHFGLHINIMPKKV